MQLLGLGAFLKGQMVPPGVYLYRVVVDADEEKGQQIGSTCVAY